ncbi:MAG: hypothetical protein WC435_03090 [Candidatus Paceibacterota bacterium]
MKKTGCLHTNGVICVITALIFLGNIIFKILSPSTQTEIGEETYDLVNNIAIMLLLGFFAGLFFLWNISAKIDSFLTAVLMVEKEKKNGD